MLVIGGCKKSITNDDMASYWTKDKVLHRVVYEYVDDVKSPKEYVLIEYDCNGLILREISKSCIGIMGTDYNYHYDGTNLIRSGLQTGTCPPPIVFFTPICYSNPAIWPAPFDNNGNLILTTKSHLIDSNGNEIVTIKSSAVDSNRNEIAIIEASTSTIFRPYTGNNYPKWLSISTIRDIEDKRIGNASQQITNEL